MQDIKVDQVYASAVTTIRLTESSLNDFSNIMTYFANISYHTIRQEHAINELAGFYSAYLGGVDTLVAGYLPIYMIRESALAHMLHEVRESLKSTRQNLFVTHDDIF